MRPPRKPPPPPGKGNRPQRFDQRYEKPRGPAGDRAARPLRPRPEGRGSDHRPERNERADRHERHERPTGGDRRPHQHDLVRVCGLPSVQTLFDTAPDRIERLFFIGNINSNAVNPMCEHLSRVRRPYRRVEAEELKKVAGTAMHGGIVAFATPPEVAELTPEIVAQLAADKAPVLILDGVSNPQNLGAIARTAAFFGCRHLVLSDHPAQAGISDASYRVAKGGLDQITLYRVHDLPGALRAMKAGHHVVGTVAERGKAWLDTTRLDKPVALVLGNEEHGMPRETQAACDTLITLPGAGRIQSLNVSATASILIHGLLTPAGNR